MEGQGTCSYPTKDVYTGEFKGSKRHGEGRQQYHNRWVYEGGWDSDKRSGKGDLRNLDSPQLYVGEFFEGERWGHGREVCADGTEYVGDWRDGIREGWGTATYSDGGVYRGFWKSGARHGSSIFTAADGSRYEGEWHLDCQHGHGNLERADGAKYEGLFRKGAIFGQGTMYAAAAFSNPAPECGVWMRSCTIVSLGASRLEIPWSRYEPLLTRGWHGAAGSSQTVTSMLELGNTGSCTVTGRWYGRTVAAIRCGSTRRLRDALPVNLLLPLKVGILGLR